MAYDFTPIRQYCEQIGIAFAEEDAVDFAKAAEQADLTQAQFDAVLREYAGRVKYYSDTRTYSFWQRVKIAFYWLTGYRG